MSGSATSLHACCARYRETSAPLRPVTSLVAALMSALALYVVYARRPDPTRRGQRRSCPRGKLIGLVEQPIRRAPESEVYGMALLRVIERGNKPLP